MSETENPSTTVADEKVEKPVKTDSVSTDKSDGATVAAKTVLNGDSVEAKETKAVDSESKESTVENGIEEPVAGEPVSAEAVTDDAKHSAEDVAASSTVTEAVAKVAEAVSEVVEAASKVVEPASEVVQPEKPAESAPTPAKDAEKPAEKAASEVADAKAASSEASEAKCEPSEKSAEGDEKSGGLFTDDMVEKIEQNYSPTETGALNLLEMPDDEMFASETKPAAKTNGSAEPSENGKSEDGSEAAKKTDEESDIEEAHQMFLQGKRNSLVKDFESAANILGEACGKYSAIYGDLGVECAEVYMAYGQALLEWWRIEDSNRKNNDAVDEAKADDEEASDEAPVKENGVGAVPQSEEAGEDEPMEVDQADETAPAAEETIDESRAEEQAENGDEEDEDEDEIESDEEVDNLQIAWEILEVAKKIYEKTNDVANLAKVHSKLGEISIANGNLMYAVDDLKRALELVTAAPVVDVRHKANVHFQLYIAHTMRCSFPEAEAELRVAKSTFESHLRQLRRKLEAAASKSAEREAHAAEVREIEEVLRDLGEKLVECQKEKRELISAISDVIKTKHPAAAAEGPSSSASMEAPSSSAAAATFSPRKADVPINNISHLVRKKPKPVAEEAKAEAKVEQKPEKTEEVAGAAGAESNGPAAESKEADSKVADGKEADASAESSVKRKAEDVLESAAKKVCS